jgi:hypothetical protein
VTLLNTKLINFKKEITMRSNFAQAVNLFLNPQTLIIFLISSLSLSVLGNAVWQSLFDAFGGSANFASLKIAVITVSILLLSFTFMLIKASGFARKTGEPRKNKPARHRGLILLVSRDEPCRVAIKYHLPKLQYCWLLQTTARNSKEAIEKIQNEFSSLKGIQEPRIVNDANQPLEFYRQIEEIFKNLPSDISEEEVIADYTGLTAHASVAVVLASLKRRCSLQYTPAILDNNEKIIGSADPIEITLREVEEKLPDFTATRD